MQPYLTDASLSTTTALPSSANTAVTGAATDTLNSSYADTAQRMEWEIDAPALNTTQLPNNAMMSYAVVMSASSNMGSPVLIYDNVIQQTGAGGAGAAAATARFRLPFQPGGQNSTLRYLAIRATGANGNANCAASSYTLLPRF